jgi:hypothetical protein
MLGLLCFGAGGGGRKKAKTGVGVCRVFRNEPAVHCALVSVGSTPARTEASPGIACGCAERAASRQMFCGQARLRMKR